MKVMLILVLAASVVAGCGSDIHEKTKRWEAAEFKPEKWQELGPNERSRMVYSFLSQYEIKAMSSEDVSDVLGIPTAYYEYDEFPAYDILVGRTRYVMAFPVARDTQRVRELVFDPPL